MGRIQAESILQLTIAEICHYFAMGIAMSEAIFLGQNYSYYALGNFGVRSFVIRLSLKFTDKFTVEWVLTVAATGWLLLYSNGPRGPMPII